MCLKLPNSGWTCPPDEVTVVQLFQQIYTIGVGLENETDKDDLVRITGSERRFIQGNSITDLKDSQILEELKETLCKDQCTFAA